MQLAPTPFIVINANAYHFDVFGTGMTTLTQIGRFAEIPLIACVLAVFDFLGQ
ncbi:MAG: hypothetical protein LDL41_22815 [Coleofasciculus sp. S288]|nr:hypothetical protein [Coleofasciculus sp. S288]